MISSTTCAARALLTMTLAAALGTTAGAQAAQMASPPPGMIQPQNAFPTNIVPQDMQVRGISLRGNIVILTYQAVDGSRTAVRAYAAAKTRRFARSFPSGTRVTAVVSSGSRAKLFYALPGDATQRTLPLTLDLRRPITRSRLAVDRR